MTFSPLILLLTFVLALSPAQTAKREKPHDLNHLWLIWGRMIKEGRNQEFFESLEREPLAMIEYKAPSPPLIVAAHFGNLEVVQGLLKRGAEVDFRDSTGHTALHVAMRENHPEIVSVLLKAKADPYVLTQFFYTPLEQSFDHENSAAREKFLEHMRETGQLKRVIDWQLAVWEVTYRHEWKRRDVLPETKAKLKRFVPEWDGR